MPVLRLVGHLRLLVEIEVIIQEIAIHQKQSNNSSALGIKEGEKIEARYFDQVPPYTNHRLPTRKAAIEIDGEAARISSILLLNQLLDLKPKHCSAVFLSDNNIGSSELTGVKHIARGERFVQLASYPLIKRIVLNGPTRSGGRISTGITPPSREEIKWSNMSKAIL